VQYPFVSDFLTKGFSDLTEKRDHRLGRYISTTFGDETVRAFVPPPLPPVPPLRLDGLQKLLEQANQSVGRLDGLASALPNLHLFIMRDPQCASVEGTGGRKRARRIQAESELDRWEQAGQRDFRASAAPASDGLHGQLTTIFSTGFAPKEIGKHGSISFSGG
jgi:hypothetical protein